MTKRQRAAAPAPTLNAKGAARLLNCSIVWVHALTRRGTDMVRFRATQPERAEQEILHAYTDAKLERRKNGDWYIHLPVSYTWGDKDSKFFNQLVEQGCIETWRYEEGTGIIGWIMNDEGTGWMPKVGTGVNGAEVLYDREAILAYREAHPDVETRIKDVAFTPGEEQLIVDLATPEYIAHHYVTRRRVLKEAQAMSLDDLKKYGILKKSSLRNVVFYPKIMAVAQKHEWPLPPRQKKNTAVKRK